MYVVITSGVIVVVGCVPRLFESSYNDGYNDGLTGVCGDNFTYCCGSVYAVITSGVIVVVGCMS